MRRHSCPILRTSRVVFESAAQWVEHRIRARGGGKTGVKLFQREVCHCRRSGRIKGIVFIQLQEKNIRPEFRPSLLKDTHAEESPRSGNSRSRKLPRVCCRGGRPS